MKNIENKLFWFGMGTAFLGVLFGITAIILSLLGV